MSDSKRFRLLLTQNDKNGESEILAIVMRECHPNLEGNIKPPKMVRHGDDDFELVGPWMMQDCFVYRLNMVRKINAFLFPSDPRRSL